jgi:hypothetical protein
LSCGFIFSLFWIDCGLLRQATLSLQVAWGPLTTENFGGPSINIAFGCKENINCSSNSSPNEYVRGTFFLYYLVTIYLNLAITINFIPLQLAFPGMSARHRKPAIITTVYRRFVATLTLLMSEKWVKCSAGARDWIGGGDEETEGEMGDWSEAQFSVLRNRICNFWFIYRISLWNLNIEPIN